MPPPPPLGLSAAPGSPKSQQHWRKLRLLTSAVGKWKVSAADVLAKKRADEQELQAARLSVLDEILRFLKAKEVLVPRLRACITASGDRAQECHRGLEAALQLLRFDSLPAAAKAAIISKFVFFRKVKSNLHDL